MYQQIKIIEETSVKNVFIAQVTLWNRSIEKTQKEISEYINDPTLLEIESLSALMLLRHDYILLYFEDKYPPLKNYPSLDEPWVYAVVYKSPFITETHPDGAIRQIQTPTHERYLQMLLYYCSKFPDEKNGGIKGFLLEETVKHYIYETTKKEWGELNDNHFSSRRFSLIENVQFLSRDIWETEKIVEFIKQMYEMNIYEFMFKMFR